MRKNEFITYVPKDLILNPNTTGLDLMTFNICNMYGINFFKEPIYISSAFITGQLGSLNSYRSKIKTSLQYLADRYPGFLSETEIPNIFKLDANVKLLTASMARVPYQEIEIILNSKYSYTYELIKLFYIIIASLKSDILHFKGTDYGITWYANNMNISNKTVHTYMSSLRKLKLIYLFEDKERKNNLIGRYKDKQALQEWAELNGYKGEGSRTTANEARSLMMKYHRLEKGVQYSENELSKIKAYIQYYNSIHPDKKKDLSVFDSIQI